MLRARFHAQPAGVTLFGTYGEGLLVSMGEGFDPTLQGQLSALGRRENSQLEDLIGTHSNTVVLALASISIDPGRELAWGLLAVGARWRVARAHRLEDVRPARKLWRHFTLNDEASLRE
jgi:hypothetical protein